jgi:hypothetical protein
MAALAEREEAPEAWPRCTCGHQWPPKMGLSPEGKWALMQPSEDGSLPMRGLPILGRVDEVWPTSGARRSQNARAIRRRGITSGREGSTASQRASRLLRNSRIARLTATGFS